MVERVVEPSVEASAPARRVSPKRRLVMRLIGAGAGLAIYFGWQAWKQHETERSPCTEIVTQSEIEALSGKRVDDVAGHVGDGECTAGFFPVRSGLESTKELLIVEMSGGPSEIERYEEIAKIHGPFTKRLLPELSPTAEALLYTDGTTSVLFEQDGVVVRMEFRNDLDRERAIAAVVGAKGRLGAVRLERLQE